MLRFLTAYAVTAVLFLAMDFVWIGIALKLLYKPRLGALLLDRPNFAVAGLFYLVYAVGIVAFAVMPALAQGGWLRALGGGALLGLVAYGAYDLTNQATIAGWSPVVTAADLLWGTVATGVAAAAAYFILGWIKV